MKSLAEVRKAIKAGKFEFKEAADRAIYDWADLLDGSLKALEEGKDFTCKPQTIRMMAVKQAAKIGKKVKVEQVEGGLILQAFEMTDEQIAAQKAKDAKAAAAKAAKKDDDDEETDE